MHEKFYEHAERALRETTANGFSDDVIRAEGYTAFVSKAFVEKYTALVIKDLMTHLAAHALSNSSAMDVYIQWSEMYEGKVPDRGPKPPPRDTNDYDF